MWEVVAVDGGKVHVKGDRSKQVKNTKWYIYRGIFGMSAIALAKRLNVPRTRIELAREGPETALTVDTAMRLSKFFGNTPEFWMNLQRACGPGPRL